MSTRFECGDGAALMAYVYQDGDERERQSVAAHVATCATCADEVSAIQSTRAVLSEWAPPDAALGFQVPSVPQAPAPVLRPARWWRQPLPAWAQVAAAVVLFSAGVGMGAWRANSESPAPVGLATATAVTPAVSSDDLRALESRLLAEIARRDAAEPAAAVPASSQDGDRNEALLRQVRGLINDSEERMQRELTLRTAAVVRDVDAQRRGDLARIERTFGQMEGTTNVQVEQQRQMLNYLMRVSQQQPGR